MRIELCVSICLLIAGSPQWQNVEEHNDTAHTKWKETNAHHGKQYSTSAANDMNWQNEIKQ